MEKWADYLISKLSFNDTGRLISDIAVHEYLGNQITLSETRNREWMVQKVLSGKSFTGVGRNIQGFLTRQANFRYEGGYFKWGEDLPRILTRRKTFISYYHKDDQLYRERFEKLFQDLVISKSVDGGDIDSDNCDDYIKQLIQNEYLSDTTVLVVLIGPKTKCRKHVDWEISGALDQKVGDSYSGLLGLLLPTHPDYDKGNYSPANIPERLELNIKSGYALIKNWTENRVLLQNWIEEAFNKRSSEEKIVNKYLLQMKKNTCE